MDTLRDSSSVRPFTLAIASSFTATPIEQPLTFWLEEVDLPGSITFAPYRPGVSGAPRSVEPALVKS